MISKGHVSLVVGAALVWSGCGSQETTAPEASATPQLEVSFAKGRKPKPPTLPGDCLVGQTVVWDGTAFVCADRSITGWEIVQNAVTGSAGTALCPVGKVVLGGGYLGTGGNVFDNGPVQVGSQWGWSITQGHLSNQVIYAICADGAA